MVHLPASMSPMPSVIEPAMAADTAITWWQGAPTYVSSKGAKNVFEQGPRILWDTGGQHRACANNIAALRQGRVYPELTEVLPFS